MLVMTRFLIGTNSRSFQVAVLVANDVQQNCKTKEKNVKVSSWNRRASTLRKAHLRLAAGKPMQLNDSVRSPSGSLTFATCKTQEAFKRLQALTLFLGNPEGCPI